jgi:peptidylprolyl isomerase
MRAGCGDLSQTISKKEPDMRERIVALTPLMKIGLMLFAVMGLALTNGCGKKEGEKTNVERGDRVKVQYTGSLEDGTIFDRSKTGEPLEFTVGSGQLLPGFDQAIEGMKLNEEKTVTIKAEDAYGERDESLIRVLPKLEKGMVITLHGLTGRPAPATIMDITEDSATVDFNHPLAGDLTLNIKVVGIE